MKKLIVALCLFPAIGFTSDNSTGATDDEFAAERMRILAELGLPLPDSGIKLVPRAAFNLTSEELAVLEVETQQTETLGYIEDKSPRPMELLHFRKHAQLQIKQNGTNENEGSTHIRTSAHELKFAFIFTPLPATLAVSSIGIVPQGAFTDKGWTGAVQFFEIKGVGTCAYAQMNVKAAHSATEIALEDADYLVNAKLSLLEVRGSLGSGFDYRVKWFDDVTFHELECANLRYSAQIKNNVVGLANTIDDNYT